MFIAKRSGSFAVGTTVGVLLVINIDDLTYTQLQRHVIHPFRILISKPTPLESKEIIEVGTGAGRFAAQFKPKATTRVSAKQLLLDDGDYSTRQDHYFNYINRRHSEPQSKVLQKNKEKAILDGLGLDQYLSADVRKHIEELEEDPELVQARYAYMNQKHSKQDYAMIKDMSVDDVFGSITIEKKKVKFDEDRMDQYEDLVKIEAKKKKQREKKASKQKLREKKMKKAMVQKELDVAINTPGYIEDPQQALDLIEKQELTAKSLSKADIKNLQKLKEDATDYSDMNYVPPSSVKISFQMDDASSIQDQIEEMDKQKIFDQAPTKEDLEMQKKLERDEQERHEKANQKPSMAAVMQKTREQEWKRQQRINK